MVVPMVVPMNFPEEGKAGKPESPGEAGSPAAGAGSNARAPPGVLICVPPYSTTG